jgi:D-alanyl-D-alanine dipeptidase
LADHAHDASRSHFYPKPLQRPSFDERFDLRSFGEPLRKLRAIRIVENHEPLVDLRDVCPNVILRPGCLPLLRETVAGMVVHVQNLLPQGYTLTVGTCLRTMDMQRQIRENIQADQIKKHPDWSLATLNRTLNRMVAPLDPLSPPPHTTGGALDVGVRGPDGQDLNFSGHEDWWSVAPTYFHKLTESARANREMLIAAMEHAGLTNYLGEWWHWSYGDQGWALRVGSPIAYYGPVTVDNAEALRVPKEEPQEPAPTDDKQPPAE